MPAPVVADLEAEECLVSSLLLHDQHEVFGAIENDALWYAHTRLLLTAARVVHHRGEPTTAVFVMYELRDHLDDLSWKGQTGEVLVLDMLSRRMLDIQAFMGLAMARIVREYAERRRLIQEAEKSAVSAYQRTVSGKSGWIQL